MRGDVAHKMYAMPAVYQRICNQMIQILHWLVDSEFFLWSLWRKPAGRVSTANGCKMTVR